MPIAPTQPAHPTQSQSSVFALAPFLLSCLAAAAWYLRPELGPWPLLLVGAGVVGRALAGRQALVPSRAFDLPLALFLLTALMGVAIAYDPAAAWDKFWVILGGLVLYEAIGRAPERVRVGRLVFSPLALFFILLPTTIALYYLATMATSEWSAWTTAKMPALDPLLRWLATWQPQIPGHRLHPNVAGGLLAALLPLQVAAVWGGRRPAWWGIPLILVVAGTLVLTVSRGAWLALLVSAVGWILYRLGERVDWPPGVAGRPWSQAVFWGLTLVLGGLALMALAVSGLVDDEGRYAALLNGIGLARDYTFSGLGLAGFQMAYSSYVLMLHVGYWIHSHNLLLDIWLEQGLLALLAFAWLILVALRPQARPAAWRSAALVMLSVILLHGLVDDAFYGSRGVLLLFVPFALLARGETVPAVGRYATRRVLWIVPLAAGLILLLLPASRAAFQANLGALAQTRAELSVYTWPKWPIQDELRRNGAVDLAPAVARYQAALALDPNNVTANRRLGQIALSLGKYQTARRYLEAAYAVAPDERATRQLLAEAYAVTGDAAQAWTLWRSVDTSMGQLSGRVWWYEHVGDEVGARGMEQLGR